MQDDDIENGSGEEPPPLIAEGIYPARAKSHHPGKYSYGEKLVFEWQVFLSKYQTESVSLSSYYRIERGGGGRFRWGRYSNYQRDWIAAKNGKFPGNFKSLPPAIFYEKLLFVRVVTVKNNGEGPLHPANYYSRVGSVMRPVEEKDNFEGLPIQLSEFKWKTE